VEEGSSMHAGMMSVLRGNIPGGRIGPGSSSLWPCGLPALAHA
jgi:hypothetical protein